jgi:DNA-binding transcriptional MerR regulator
LYGERTIERLHFIQQMQALGFSLREIRELIELRTSKVESCEKVQRLLREKLANVRAKMCELQRLESELLVDLRKCDKELKRRMQQAPSACPVLEESERTR